MRAASGRMHIDNASRQYVTASGEQRTSRCYLLRRSYRDAGGKPRNETLANLSALPPETIEVLRKSLKGAALIDAEAPLWSGRGDWLPGDRTSGQLRVVAWRRLSILHWILERGERARTHAS